MGQIPCTLRITVWLSALSCGLTRMAALPFAAEARTVPLCRPVLPGPLVAVAVLLPSELPWESFFLFL